MMVDYRFDMLVHETSCQFLTTHNTVVDKEEV
ncbi:Uncharacterized protein APZ42_022224 [Daphnia magna]|uniref:Uncharacterized protein n=1 Tax=Daphnia magna TaxID=35525 RepID=A0A164W4U6_9CRUS|nr:Uncharacterized protein APZ42_022224 [Daphnia magna]